jgi:hypothetical protein
MLARIAVGTSQVQQLSTERQELKRESRKAA